MTHQHLHLCAFCGWPLSLGDEALHPSNNSEIVCSRGCGVNLAAHREYLDSPGLDYIPGRDPAESEVAP